ncbi:MAG: hypothetical protein HEEMFOPI_01255 [Holosporales bacterium]
MFKTLIHDKKSAQRVTLNDIKDFYDVYFIDLWGVMHDGQAPYPDAILAVNQLLDLRKKIIFLSNMPRPKTIVVDMLKKYGLKDGFFVLTSGDSAREYLLKNYKETKIFHFGDAVNQAILKDLDVITTKTLDDAGVVLLTLFTDTEKDLKEAEDLAKKIGALKLPCVCANPDLSAQNGDMMRVTSGYFAKIIEDHGGFVHYIGKPYLAIYQAAFELFNIHSLEKCLMIGDTIETDIIGGFNAGMDTLLTLTGITKADLLKHQCSLDAHCDLHQWPLPTYIADKLA